MTLFLSQYVCLMLLLFLWSWSALDIHTLFIFPLVFLVPWVGLLSVIVVFPGIIVSFHGQTFCQRWDCVQAQRITKEQKMDIALFACSPQLILQSQF